jgi:hypothetical protein
MSGDKLAIKDQSSKLRMKPLGTIITFLTAKTDKIYRLDVCNSRTRFSTKKLESGIGVHKEEQTYVFQKMTQTAENLRSVGRKTSILPFQ